MMAVFRGCSSKGCLSTNCKNSLTQTDLQKLQNKNKVLKEFLALLKKKENVDLPCVAHELKFSNDKIELENEEEPKSCTFMLDFVPKSVILKLNKQEPLTSGDIVQVSLRFSLNRILNLETDASVNSYFAQWTQFIDLLKKYEHKEVRKFLRVFQDKLGWEFSEFLGHLERQNIRVEHLVLLVKLLCNLDIFFDFGFFDPLETFQGILQLLDWDQFAYLFAGLPEQSSANIFTENENQQKLKLQTVISKKELESLVETLQNILTIKLLEQPKFTKIPKAVIDQLRPVCNLLDFVWRFQGFLSPLVQLGKLDFMNSFLSDDFKYKDCFLYFIKKKILSENKYKRIHGFYKTKLPFGSFNFLNYRFLYSVERKVEVLHFESTVEQQCNFQANFSIMRLLQSGRLNSGLDLVVRRDSLVEDALVQLTRNSVIKNLKNPLKVQFRGEPGMDEGGLTKEFFHLITQELFHPKYGMFTLKNESFWWLKQDSLDCNLNFELVGMLMGLAIYNKTLLDLKFPLALYKKLIIDHCLKRDLHLGRTEFLGLQDLREVEPQLFSTLSNVLKLDLPPGNDVGLTFEISYESWGISKGYNLIPDGHKVPVTNENKHFFVEKYLDWFFNISIEKQYKPFSIGFFKVLGDSVLQIFSAEDLQMAICGKTELNFDELKQGSRYQDGFTADSLTVRHFWKILKEEFSEQDKKSFLKFLTGNDRAPLRGLAEIKMTVSR